MKIPLDGGGLTLHLPRRFLRPATMVHDCHGCTADGSRQSGSPDRIRGKTGSGIAVVINVDAAIPEGFTNHDQ
jgi:hypothetical protein